jgi:type I phosphodiesterase/nucleotide pyrophosphatase
MPRYGTARKRANRHFTPLHHFSIVVSLYLVFACLIGAGTARILHARSSPPMRLLSYAGTQPKYLVLMVLDDARPDYFGLTPLPHVDQLRSSGAQFTHAMAGILESEIPAGHATIATGSRPDANGILGFDWGNDDDSRVSLFSPDKMQDLEQIIEDNGASTLAGLYKDVYPGAKAVAISGHKYYAAAPLGGPDADAIMYYKGDSRGHYVPVAVPGHVPPPGVLDAPGIISPTTHLPTGGESDRACPDPACGERAALTGVMRRSTAGQMRAREY